MRERVRSAAAERQARYRQRKRDGALKVEQMPITLAEHKLLDDLSLLRGNDYVTAIKDGLRLLWHFNSLLNFRDDVTRRASDENAIRANKTGPRMQFSRDEEIVTRNAQTPSERANQREK